MMWRIGTFPELNGLDYAQRRAVLRHVRWWVYPTVVFRAGAIAFIVFILAAFNTFLFVGQATTAGDWLVRLPAISLALIALGSSYLHQIA